MTSKGYVDMKKVTACVLTAVGIALACAADNSLSDFPRAAGEIDDTARLQRAVDATPSGVLHIPAGVYLISSTVSVTNLCSLEMNKSAVLRAVKEMPFVLRVNNVLRESLPRDSDRYNDYNMFVTGGQIDGNALAGCMMLDGFFHYTLRDTTFLNGRKYGLCVCGENSGGAELVANNLYFKCVKPGLAGNTAVYIRGGDSHYTDCIVVDYTIGFHLAKGGSNRLTRCHVWGGLLPAPSKGEPREMLKGSINFKINGAAAILRDCYADTGEIGFDVDAWDTRILGCSYFNNKVFGLDNITVFRHKYGRLLVKDCTVVKPSAHSKVYEGCGTVEWRDMMYINYAPTDDCPGALKFDKPPTDEDKVDSLLVE